MQNLVKSLGSVGLAAQTIRNIAINSSGVFYNPVEQLRRIKEYADQIIEYVNQNKEQSGQDAEPVCFAYGPWLDDDYRFQMPVMRKAVGSYNRPLYAHPPATSPEPEHANDLTLIKAAIAYASTMRSEGDEGWAWFMKFAKGDKTALLEARAYRGDDITYDASSELLEAEALIEALRESNSLLAAMLHEKRPDTEINDQINMNNDALAALPQA